MPQGQETYDTDEQLEIGNEVIDTILMPDIVSVREEFFIQTVDYAITANKSHYQIPPRAFAEDVRKIQIIDGDSIDSNLPRINREQITTSQSGGVIGFYPDDDNIVLYPTPAFSGKTLRVSYPLRHSILVRTSATAVITGINGSTLTFNTIPSSWVSGNSFDFIKQDGSHRPVSIDNTSVTVSAPDIIFSSLPDTLRVGDYVALAGETSLIQLPQNYRAILAQAVAANILESMNQPSSDKAFKTLDRMRKDALRSITPRIDGAPKMIIAGSNWVR